MPEKAYQKKYFDASGLTPFVGRAAKYGLCNALGAAAMDLCMKLWVEKDGKVVFGGGRYQLLKAIEEHGSLAGAARALKMSYRAAWGRLKASEKRLGRALVQRSGSGRRGHQLTRQARQFMDLYENLQTQCEAQLKEAERAWRDELP